MGTARIVVPHAGVRAKLRVSLAASLAIVFWQGGAAADVAQGMSSGADPSSGQTTRLEAESTRREQARLLFDDGMDRSGRAQWELALDAFRRSFQIHPSKAAIKNTAFCLEKLGRFDEALDALDKLVQMYPQFTAEERAAYDEKLLQLSQQVGVVELRGAEPGSLVWVDDRERGSIPLGRPLRIAAGAHRLRIAKEGVAPPFEQAISIAAGERKTITMDASSSPLGRPSVRESALPEPSAPRRSKETTDVSLATEGNAAAAPHADARFGLAVEAGGALSSLGGDVLGCAAGCDRDIALGGRFLARFAYRLGESTRAFVDAGYLTMTQHASNRTTSLLATGIEAPGKATDTMTLSGEMVGLSLEYQPRLLRPVLARLGAGALFGGVRDTRRGEFQQTAGADRYHVSDQWQRPAAEWGYLSMGVEVGRNVAKNLYLGVAADFMALVAFRQPRWDERVSFASEAGQSWFASERLAAKFLLIACPSVSARYDF